MMRILGGWIALTPEVDAKLLFGRHVWDCAQHADLWGKRLPELRAAAQVSEPGGPATPPERASVAQDLVTPPSGFDVEAALGDLAAPLAAHRAALARGELAAVRGELGGEAPPEAVVEYARLVPPFERVEVVGVARIGRQRVVKLALAGPRGRQVLQERWTPTEEIGRAHV